MTHYPYVLVAILVLRSASLVAQAPVTLVDSTGRSVGPVIDLERKTVLLQFAGQLIPLTVNRAGFFLTGTLYYESFNCSGQAYFVGQSAVPILETKGFAVTAPGNVLYVQQPGQPPVNRALCSDKQAYVECETYGEAMDACISRPTVPAIEAGNLKARFKPPYRFVLSDDVVDLAEP